VILHCAAYQLPDPETSFGVIIRNAIDGAAEFAHQPFKIRIFRRP